MFARTRGLLIALVILAAATCALAQDTGSKATARLSHALAAKDKAATETPLTVWVRFTDKGLAGPDLEAALARTQAGLSTANLARRAKASEGGALVDEDDLPVAASYLDAVAATGAVPRQTSRWLNAASFEATPAQLAAIARLPFVQVLDLVGGGSPIRPEFTTEAPVGRDRSSNDKVLGELDYGPSLPALEQIGVTDAHARGFSGAGVIIGVLDTGFSLDHHAFKNLDVLDSWDFVNGGSDVGNRQGDDPDQEVYGTATLSALAGFETSNIVGSAYGASVILAKTEDLKDETPAEEDNWIAALEWAEGLGADIIVSGLGYYDWYEFSDLDGNTAAITVAAEMAAARGVCVVNQVGMERANAWGAVIPPADGRTVIAVGATDANNQVTWYSSPGPTADGRIKPDVMALGDGVPVAASIRNDLYNFGYGTNYASALVGGAVALMLEQNPSLNPIQVMTALHETGGRADFPDNDFGWGLANSAAAMDYWSPVITHAPLADSQGGTGPMPVTATITGRLGLDETRLSIAWRANGGHWTLEPLTSAGGDEFTGSIPPQSRSGTAVDYYLVATDLGGHSASHPGDAPARFHSFRVGADTTPPVITHSGLADQTADLWAPVVVAEVTDNLGLDRVEIIANTTNGYSSGTQAMVMTEEGRYELAMPVPPLYAQQGVTVSYLITAYDQADVPNVAFSGPYSLDILATRGLILLVDDRPTNKAAPEGRTYTVQANDKTTSEYSVWLEEVGFTTDVISADEVTPGSFNGYDVVMVASGSNWSPLAYPELRRAMIRWVEEGGRLVVEGGEIAYAADVQPGYPDLIGTALPIKAFMGDDGAILRVPSSMADHPLAIRPHVLPNPLTIENSNGFDYGATDLVSKADDAFVVMKSVYASDIGGIVVHDDNTGPDSGQIVYMPFDVSRAGETDGRAVLENTMVYLTAKEGPGTGSIQGTALLAGSEDHGGVKVRHGMLQSTLTAPDGSFTLDGLWGGTYTLTAEKDGYAPQNRVVTVVDGQVTGGVAFYLAPVSEVNLTASPGLSIPDNNPTGVESSVTVVTSGQVLGLDVDVDISHFAIGNLIVTLTNPAGTTVTLHNKTGSTIDDLVGNWPASLIVDGPGTLDDFLNEDAAGTWTMKVVDAVFGASGTFNTWGLNLLVNATGVAAVDPGTPVATRLVGNVPNPFNPRTTIAFEVAHAGRVNVDVYDVRGRLVRRIADRSYGVGRHEVVWDGRDENGGSPASGIYFCRLRTGGSDEVRKMMLVR